MKSSAARSLLYSFLFLCLAAPTKAQTKNTDGEVPPTRLPTGTDDAAITGQQDNAEETIIFCQEAVWSPHDRYLLISRHDGNQYSLYVVKSDGKGLTQIAAGPDYWATWSPDGKSITFHSDRDKNGEIYRANADGTGAIALTKTHSNETTPSWSPDGNAIAFSSDRDGHYQIYLMAPDGSDPRRLSTSDEKEYNPTWSPDGSRIAFFATDKKKEDWVTVIDRDGGNRTRVTRGTFPDWAPDSERLLYDRDHAVYVMDVASGAEVKLIENAFNAKWSHAGTQIVFMRGRWPESDVFLANPDGSGIRPLGEVFE